MKKPSRTGKHMLGRKLSPETRAKISAANEGSNNAFFGKKHSAESRARMSTSHTGIPLSKKTREKMSLVKKGLPSNTKGMKFGPRSDEVKRKLSFAKSGPKHHNWQGGISPINMRIRNSWKNRSWRREVLKRDNFSCIWCGDTGPDLNVDHIKPFAYFPELRFDINNGRTLCKNCHMKTESYGGKAKKLKQHA